MCVMKYKGKNRVSNESVVDENQPTSESEVEDNEESSQEDTDSESELDHSDTDGLELNQPVVDHTMETSLNNAEENRSDNDDDDDDDEESDAVGRETLPEDDDLLAEIKYVRSHTKKEAPPTIDCQELVVDISFHPKTNVLAGASLDGNLLLYKYDTENTILSDTLEVHTKPCRVVEYSDDGDLLFSASRDKSIMITDSHTGKLKQFYDEAHNAPLFCLTIISEHVLASGDEDGGIKLWDIRHRNPIYSLADKVHDYISGMVTTDSKRYLACTSGEGTVTTINLPARKLYTQSECFDGEYTCVDLCKEETKLIAGTDRGKFVFYNWGEFGLHSDIFPCRSKKGITCLLSISDNIVITGWDDGMIRATYLFPNKNLGIVGLHDCSVDALDISHDGQFMASCGLDSKIRFWPLSFFNELDFSDILSGDTNLPSSQYTDRKTFFSGLAETTDVPE